ncbi:MAG: adenylate/guanylate cyclase domain-containing protein [Sphingomicrobium sp.]
MFAFVVCHLTAHTTLLISTDFAQFLLSSLMYPWRTYVGTTLLITAFILHYSNALWSIYIRRSLRISRWEWWQLALGLSIPLLLTLHVSGTRIADTLLGVDAVYSSVLISQWVRSSWVNLLQIAAVITVWSHACIGLHFWLRTKVWYPLWRGYLGSAALLLPTLALAGYVSAGNQLLRLAKSDPETIKLLLDENNMTDAAMASIYQIALVALAGHFVLTAIPFGARAIRDWLDRFRRQPILSHARERKLPVRPGATVLETLREHGVPHAAVCGGRARCTTCRVLVTRGLDDLPGPEAPEAKALARIDAAPGIRLACQICPTSDISVMPLLATDASAADGSVKGGLEGSERPITVMFVDFRGSTSLGESRMPYDVLFLLNRFFHEMTKALVATNGHYSQFTGDGLMALYGLHEHDPAAGAADALRGAKEMLLRLDQLNRQLHSEMSKPLRIGVGIHFSVAIVGTMGPPRSQIITAIGDLVNTCARLESLTKEYDCPVIVSRLAAEVAGLNVSGLQLHNVQVRGRLGSVEFYALQNVPEI